jgi:hypothetical protein
MQRSAGAVCRACEGVRRFRVHARAWAVVTRKGVWGRSAAGCRSRVSDRWSAALVWAQVPRRRLAEAVSRAREVSGCFTCNASARAVVARQARLGRPVERCSRSRRAIDCPSRWLRRSYRGSARREAPVGLGRGLGVFHVQQSVRATTSIGVGASRNRFMTPGSEGRSERWLAWAVAGLQALRVLTRSTRVRRRC